MSVDIDTLIACTDDLLSARSFKDYCPNGLQVEGKKTIKRLVCGVTANQALIDRAVEAEADALLVHHGFFWGAENPCITGMKYRRIQALLKHDINLIVYHLPLDAHPELGNNAQLAQRLNIIVDGGMEDSGPLSVGSYGRLSKPLSAANFCQLVAFGLDREPLLIAAGDHDIHTIAWCTGAAQNDINRAAELGVDAYLSGEISENTVHSAREQGIHYIAAGHHATERYGVQALGKYLAEIYDLDYQFIDIDCPA